MIKKFTAIFLCLIFVASMTVFSVADESSDLPNIGESNISLFDEENEGIELIPISKDEIPFDTNFASSIDENAIKNPGELDNRINKDKLLTNYEYEKLRVITLEDELDTAEPLTMAAYYNNDNIIITSLLIEDFLLKKHPEIKLFISQVDSKVPIFDNVITEDSQKITVNNIILDSEYSITLSCKEGDSIIQYNGSFTVTEKDTLICSYSLAKQSFTDNEKIQQELQKLEALSNEPTYVEALELEREQDSSLSRSLSIDRLFEEGLISVSSAVLYEYEPNGSMNTATRIYTDETMYGCIYPSGDLDYYKILFTSPGTADFFLLDIPQGKDYDLKVYNSAGSQIAYAGTTNTNEIITGVQVQDFEFYYVLVYGYNNSFTGAQDYRLTINHFTSDDYGDTFSSAYSIYTDVNYIGKINYGGDNDYLKFIAPRSGAYVITTTGGTDTYGYLYNSSQSLLASDDDNNGNGNFKITYNLTANQTYYVRVRAYSSSATGSYTLRVTAPLRDDHGDTFSDATLISVDRNYNCDIDYGGDNDFFKFTAPRSGSYVIETTGTDVDTYGYLYSSSQLLFREDDDAGSGVNFKITYSLTANETYYIRVRAFSSSATGAYVLQVIAPSSSQYPNNTSLVWPISSKEVTLWFGELDQLDSTSNLGIDIQQTSGNIGIYSISDGVFGYYHWSPEYEYMISVNYKYNNQYYQVRYGLMNRYDWEEGELGNGDTVTKDMWLGGMSKLNGKYILNMQIIKSTNGEPVKGTLTNGEYVNPLQFFSISRPSRDYLYQPMSVSYISGSGSAQARLALKSECLTANSLSELDIMKAEYLANNSTQELRSHTYASDIQPTSFNIQNSRFAFNLDIDAATEMYLTRAVLFEAQKQDPSLREADLRTNNILVWNPLTGAVTVRLNSITKTYQPNDASEYYTRIVNDRIVIKRNKFDVDFTAAKNISVKVFNDSSLQQEFPTNTINEINNIMGNVNTAYRNRWNIDFNVSVENLNSTTVLPHNFCTLSYVALCRQGDAATGNCGWNCNDHHKNADGNLFYFRSVIFDNSTELGILATSANLCGINDLGNHGSTMGMAYMGDRQSIVSLSASGNPNAITRNVRLVQHELSHNFNVQDGYDGGHCNPSQDCIMNRGWDTNQNFNNKTIWCDTCAAEFNRNLH